MVADPPEESGQCHRVKDSTSYCPQQAQLPPELTPVMLWTAAP